MHRFPLKEAKIVEHFAVTDDLGMFEQLGHLGAFSRQTLLKFGHYRISGASGLTF